MPDWREIVRARLTPLGLDAKGEEEIVAELAGHLEDVYEDWVRQGKSESEAAEFALSTAADWDEVRREIQVAANEEVIMNHRVKALWLPGACTIALSDVLLRLLQGMPAAPPVTWVWHGAYLLVYWQWLLCLPLIGALGAYWSRRVGGKLLERALAASFPALTWMGFPGLLLPFVLVFHWIVYHDLKLAPPALFFLLGWVVLPGASLLLGALPFFRRGAEESRPVATSH
jgi:hypothetical protein